MSIPRGPNTGNGNGAAPTGYAPPARMQAAPSGLSATAAVPFHGVANPFALGGRAPGDYAPPAPPQNTGVVAPQMIPMQQPMPMNTNAPQLPMQPGQASSGFTPSQPQVQQVGVPADPNAASAAFVSRLRSPVNPTGRMVQ